LLGRCYPRMELVDANQGLIVKRAGFQPVAGFRPTPFAVRDQHRRLAFGPPAGHQRGPFHFPLERGGRGLTG
jgi:hypothetical protein